MAIPEVLSALGTDARDGLPEVEARARQARYGPNELAGEEGASALALFLRQFKNTLIVMLLAATVLSAAVGEIVEAAIILAIVLVSSVLGFVQEYRAERALEALKEMLAPTVTVVRAGVEAEIPARDLVPGDLMVLEAGDRIPADGRLIEVRSLMCDEAALTGESTPVEKQLEPCSAEAPLGDRRNMVFTGTTVTYGRGRAAVTATGGQTELGTIAREVAATRAEPTPLERQTAEISKWLGIIALAVCFLAGGLGVLREVAAGRITLEFALATAMFAVALAVAAVPEALAAIVTGALAIGMREMAKRNALVRRMPAVETLGCTTVICSDKTGTLTKGEMTVRRLFTGGRVLEVSGVGYAPEGRLEPLPTDRAARLFLIGGVLCSDAVLSQTEGRWEVKGDPTEAALLVAAAKAGLRPDETRRAYPRLAEFPFSSERKRMTTIHRLAGGQAVAFMKGAPEVVLERCVAILDGEQERPLTDDDRRRIREVNEGMAGDALRVLAVACKSLPAGPLPGEADAEQGLTFLGLAGMMDPPRADAIEAVRVCRQVHITPVMITGDHRATAVAVARELGIFREGDVVLTGEDLGRIDDDELAGMVEKVSVYARVSPTDKLKIVRAWKARGEIVAMTGDGVNDAPALKHADIGVAMGITGTAVAKEAADLVLGDDSFATIVKAIELGRWIYDNIQKYLTYLLRANLTEVVVLGGVVTVTGPEYLPLLPAAILYVNLATDGPPALALGVSPPDPDIMRRPPRDPRESVFSREVLTLVLLGVLVESPIFIWVFFANLGSLEVARTKIFFMFVLIELILALNFRSLRLGLLQAPPHRWLVLAIAGTLALTTAAVLVPAVRETFGITVPSPTDLAATAGIGIAVLATIEIAKLLLRRATGLRGPAAGVGGGGGGT